MAPALPVASMTTSQPPGRSSSSAREAAPVQPRSFAVSRRCALMSRTSTDAAPVRLASSSIIRPIVPEP